MKLTDSWLATCVIALLGIKPTSADAENVALRGSTQVLTNAPTLQQQIQKSDNIIEQPKECFVPTGNYYETCDYIDLSSCATGCGDERICRFTVDCQPRDQNAAMLRNVVYYAPGEYFTYAQNINGNITDVCRDLKPMWAANVQDCQPLVMQYRNRRDAFKLQVCSAASELGLSSLIVAGTAGLAYILTM